MRTYVLGIAEDVTCDGTRVRGWKSKTETIENKFFFFLREGEKKLSYKVLFWLACASDLTSFWKRATPG